MSKAFAAHVLPGHFVSAICVGYLDVNNFGCFQLSQIILRVCQILKQVCSVEVCLVDLLDCTLLRPRQASCMIFLNPSWVVKYGLIIIESTQFFYLFVLSSLKLLSSCFMHIQPLILVSCCAHNIVVLGNVVTVFRLVVLFELGGYVYLGTLLI